MFEFLFYQSFFFFRLQRANRVKTLLRKGLFLYLQKLTGKKMDERIYIREIKKSELNECLEVIHQSFKTVAEQFGLTKENCPKHTSFIPLSFLETQMNWGWHMYALYAGKKIIGYMSLSKEGEESFELHNLTVLPEYRHNGFGKLLLDFSKETVVSFGGALIKIGIIEESDVLKNWYIANGFVHTGTKKFDHLPFTSGYLEWNRLFPTPHIS